MHYALAVLVTRAAEAADIDPDRVSFTRAVRRTATGTADIFPENWHTALPAVHAELAVRLVPPRCYRTWAPRLTASIVPGPPPVMTAKPASASAAPRRRPCA